MENERELEISLTYRPKPPKYKRFTAEERPEAVTKNPRVGFSWKGRTPLTARAKDEWSAAVLGS
jgi:hypothetical protein